MMTYSEISTLDLSEANRAYNNISTLQTSLSGATKPYSNILTLYLMHLSSNAKSVIGPLEVIKPCSSIGNRNAILQAIRNSSWLLLMPSHIPCGPICDSTDNQLELAASLRTKSCGHFEDIPTI
jgi:hypothetical protein